MKNFANNLRPQTLNDVIGQTHIMKFLNKMVETKTITSLILYGHPGIGKTSIAYALSNDLNKTYSYFNATTGKKQTLVELIKINDILIIDEIHRLNKDKQDILLSAIEFGKVNVIATTTENPYFTVNPAVRSRMHILELKDISVDEMVIAVKNIIQKNQLTIKISDSLIQSICKSSNGDFRFVLNKIELLEKLFPDNEVTEKIVELVIPTIHFYSDKNGDGHYDYLSAFHKSMRGSDVDACLYYLAILVKSGDMLGIERRMLAVIYEDIGLANPNLAMRVNTAMDVSKKLGFPEAINPLSVAVIDIAKSLKSNSANIAYNTANHLIDKCGVHEIPNHLKDNHYASSSKLNNGVKYINPHNFSHQIDQKYLPKKIENEKFYKKNKNDKL